MTFNPPYNNLGQATFQPGHITEYSSSNRHFAATTNPFPLFNAMTFAGNAVAITANASYRIIMKDYNGGTIVSQPYTVPAILDLVAFNNWFNAGIADLAQNVTTNAATVWNTASPMTLYITQLSFLNYGNVTISLERTLGTSTATTQLGSVAPQTVSGVETFLGGRIMVYDIDALNTTLVGNPALNNRQGSKVVKVADTATITDSGFRYLAGVSLYNTKEHNPWRHPSAGYSVFDTVRIQTVGTMTIATSSAATFGNQLPDNGILYLETAPGPNQGSITNAASATAFELPAHAFALRNVRGYVGSAEVSVTVG